MSGDIGQVSQETSPTLTDLSTDFASTSAAVPKHYHITEPWDDPSAPPSELATPRSGVVANVEHSTPAQTTNETTEDADASATTLVSPEFSPISAPTSELESAERDLQTSPGAASSRSDSSVDKIIREANILVSEMNDHNGQAVESSKDSGNTTYQDLPAAPVGSGGDGPAADPSTKLADREVALLSGDKAKAPVTKESRAEEEMDADIANKVKNLMSETGWRDRGRLKSFDYAALKQDLEDIENRLQRARTSTSSALWPDPQRKAQSLQFLMGPPRSPVERNQSPDTLTSSGKASSLAELDRSRRLKWDYAADIASGADPATPIAGLGGSGDLSEYGEMRMRMSMSQASFVSSPDPEDSALEAALKTRDLDAMKDSKGTNDSISARMEEILSRQDPQANLAAIMQQADEAERRLRERLRRGPPEGERESYLDALRSAHRDTRSPVEESERAWNRLNLNSTNTRTSGVGGIPGAIDSARSDITTSGGEQVTSGSGRLGASARSTTTAESTHPGSDDAMGPTFPDSAYGSRADPNAGTRGIYFKPKNREPKGAPQFKSPALPQRSRSGPRAAVDEISHRARPPVSPSAGFGDVRKSLETISSHDTGASTAQPLRTPDQLVDDPSSLEEYASRLRSKWERYQRLLEQGHSTPGRPTTPRELQELLRNPGKVATPREVQEMLRKPGKQSSPRDAPEVLRRSAKQSTQAGVAPKRTAAPQAEPRSRSGRSERASSGGNSGPGRAREFANGGARSRGVQTPGRAARGVAGAGDGGSEESEPEDWRRRPQELAELRENEEEEEATDSQDTLHLMTRMAGLLRSEYEEDEEGGPSLGLTDDDALSEGTFSELDPQLLRLKHLFLKQKEKWLWERARETTRRHKIQKLQRLIAERVRRHRSVEIDESLDTATLSSSILSDLEEPQGRQEGRSGGRRRDSETSSAGTLTEEPSPPSRERRAQPQPKKETKKTRTKTPILKTKADRRIQVYPPCQTWEIPAPRQAGWSNKENLQPTGVSGKPQAIRIARRPKPNAAFVDKLTQSSAREDHALQAAGGGLSWYHPVSERTNSSCKDDSSLSGPGTSRSGLHAEVGVQGEAGGPSLEAPSDGRDIQEKLQQPLLSEAFERRMPCFISKSRERQKRVRLAAEERRYVSHMEAERVKLFAGSEGGGRRRPRTQPDPLSDNLHQPQHRAFTRKEMREQNRRMYRALPEVQQRVLDEKKKAQTRSNIIRRQLYSEKVLRSVLRKRGPWVLTF